MSPVHLSLYKQPLSHCQTCQTVWLLMSTLQPSCFSSFVWSWSLVTEPASWPRPVSLPELFWEAVSLFGFGPFLLCALWTSLQFFPLDTVAWYFQIELLDLLGLVFCPRLLINGSSVYCLLCVHMKRTVYLFIHSPAIPPVVFLFAVNPCYSLWVPTSTRPHSRHYFTDVAILPSPDSTSHQPRIPSLPASAILTRILHLTTK